MRKWHIQIVRRFNLSAYFFSVKFNILILHSAHTVYLLLFVLSLILNNIGLCDEGTMCSP